MYFQDKNVPLSSNLAISIEEERSLLPGVKLDINDERQVKTKDLFHYSKNKKDIFIKKEELVDSMDANLDDERLCNTEQDKNVPLSSNLAISIEEERSLLPRVKLDINDERQVKTKDLFHYSKNKKDIFIKKEELVDSMDANLDDERLCNTEQAPDMLQCCSNEVSQPGCSSWIDSPPDEHRRSRKCKNTSKVVTVSNSANGTKSSAISRRKSAAPRKKRLKNSDKLLVIDGENDKHFVVDIDPAVLQIYATETATDNGKQEDERKKVSVGNKWASNSTDDSSLSNLTDEEHYDDGSNPENLSTNGKLSSSTEIQCLYCDFTCSQESTMTEHEQIHALDSHLASFQCHACDARFVDMQVLKDHMVRHCSIKSYSCKVCNRVFSRLVELRKHMMVSHAGEKPYMCTECDVRFSSTSALNKHAKLHLGMKPYACEFCEAKFAYPFKLRAHLLTHTGEKPFKCEQCEQSFSNLRSLKYHVITHTGEKKFECQVCDARFYNAFKLKLHSKSHTGEKLFLCSVCSARFGHASSLKTHMRSHTGEKPYKCDKCDAKFARTSILKVHQLSHTGEKRYECDKCDAKYGDYSSLKRHRMSIHEGIKPFTCSRCSAGFMRDLQLKRHLRKHYESIVDD